MERLQLLQDECLSFPKDSKPERDYPRLIYNYPSHRIFEKVFFWRCDEVGQQTFPVFIIGCCRHCLLFKQ